ncbi:hypothetical protein FAM09_25160 [Niastella caeni]|uniref:Uncharacterized protein n=1 Tax=Niastella caeni TaxID=2569763 RepID=A0A4S8HG42_9BACT|nr:hypothetical protein FAM09_25160 [Niastella caeni]
MLTIPFLNPDFIFFLVVAAIPAYYMNRYLMGWIQPRQSFGRFTLYLAAILAVALVYTFIVSWVLLKYVWPVR